MTAYTAYTVALSAAFPAMAARLLALLLPVLPLLAASVLVLLGLLATVRPVRAQVAAGETWRVAAVRPAPWGAPPQAAMAAGPQLRIEARALKGPAPLACPRATHAFVRTPPQALFEGQLGAGGREGAQASEQAREQALDRARDPARDRASDRARALGLPTGDLVTQRITCANAGFDLHLDGADRAWTALDNQVLALQRVQAEPSPEAAVQALLVRHLASDMALTPERVAAHARWLTPMLQARLERWLSQPHQGDEVPALNGDPFTDTQESPEAFMLSPARVQGVRAEVVARFSGHGLRTSVVRLQLRRVAGSWRVDDLVYRDGSRLSQLLAQGQ